jgi:hypothetical protein
MCRGSGVIIGIVGFIVEIHGGGSMLSCVQRVICNMPQIPILVLWQYHMWLCVP